MMKKMVLVPQHVFNSIMAQQQLNSGPAYLEQKDAQIGQLLKAPGINSDIKAKLFDQLIQQYLATRNDLLNTKLEIEVREPQAPPPAVSPPTPPQQPTTSTAALQVSIPKKKS